MQHKNIFMHFAMAFLMTGQTALSYAQDSYIEDDTPTALMVAVRDAPATQEEGKSWKIDLSLGAHFTSGNSETVGADAMLSIAKQIGKDLFETKLKGSYLESEIEEEHDGMTVTNNDVSEQTARAFIWYKKMLSERWYVYPFAEAFHDEPALIEIRTTTGGGIGFDIINTEQTLLSFDVGAAYVFERSTEGLEDEYTNGHARIFHRYALTDTARMWQECKFIARTEDVADYRIEAEAGIETDISSGLSLKLVAEDEYDAEPLADAEKNDISISAFLVFKY